jgi:opacity protein-like surface antigen
MDNAGAGLERRRFWPGIVIIFLTVGFLAPLPRPARAQTHTDTRNYSYIAGGIALSALAGYLIWLNRPGNDFSWASRGPGGFYLGLGAGANFAGASDWKIDVPRTRGTTVHKSITPTSSPLFNPKLGYFFHQFPYLGLEAELMYTRNKMNQTIPLRTPIGTARSAYMNDNFDNVTLALRLMGRYGFLPDDEVPFGRLQPYVGVGPGLEIVMGEDDTARNIAVEVSAGLRYMWMKNFSTFAEYKFSYQFGVEINPRIFKINDWPVITRGKYTFDYARHMVVVGMAYHFL